MLFKLRAGRSSRRWALLVCHAASRMFEILFIFGLLGLLLGPFASSSASLGGFPHPVDGVCRRSAARLGGVPGTAAALRAGGINQPRSPVPPERFYWTLHRARVAPRAGSASVHLAVGAWAAALEWPAELAWTGASVAGWLAGAIAIDRHRLVRGLRDDLRARLPLVRPDGSLGRRRLPPLALPDVGKSGFSSLGPSRPPERGEVDLLESGL